MASSPCLTIAIISGEASGDRSAAELVDAIHATRPDIPFWGIGSRASRESGVELLYDSAEWSAIGYVEALRIYPKIRFTCYPQVINEIKSRRPALVILVDFAAFNMKVLRECFTAKIPTLFYFPPRSWKKQGAAGGDLVRMASHIATPFPWSAEKLSEAGANVTWTGHPVLDRAQPHHERIPFCTLFGLDPDRPIIGLLPGSRSFEVEHNTPAMLGAAEIIRQELPGAQFIIGAASLAVRSQLELIVQNLPLSSSTLRSESEDSDSPPMVTPEGWLMKPPRGYNQAIRRGNVNPLPIVLVEGLQYDVMAHADALIACSGTATLEAAVIGTPMVIVYRGSRLMEIEYHLRRLHRIEHIGLPNILAENRIVPELLQHEANPQAIANELIPMIKDPARKGQIKAEYRAIRAQLGEPGAAQRVAKIALGLLDPSKRPSGASA